MARYGIRLMVIGFMSLAGCEPNREHEEFAEELTQRIESDAERATPAPVPPDNLRLSDNPHLGTVRTTGMRQQELPPRVESRSGLTLSSGAELLPVDIGARIAEATGIPTVIDLDPDFVVGRVGDTGPGFAPRYSGPLSSFLDILARRWDAQWEYRDSIIHITNAVSEIYLVRASASSSQLSLETNDAELDTGSISTSLKVETAIWSELANALSGIVTPGTFQLSPTTGIVSVLAPPSVHQRVRTFLDSVNTLLDARISITIVAAFLEVGDTDDYGFSLDLISSVLAGEGSLRLGRAESGTTPAIATLTVNEDAAGNLANFAGSSAILQALSSTHRIIDYRTANAVTRHGAPVPISLARKRDIVRGITVTTEDNNRTTAVEAETLSTGLSISAYPRILDDDRIHLTLSLVSSDLVTLSPFSAGTTGSIQLATVDERRLTHDFVIGRNETVLIAGYEQERSTSTDEGIGPERIPLLGGGRSSGEQRSRLLLIVTARTLR